jgi:predicted membrane protein
MSPQCGRQGIAPQLILGLAIMLLGMLLVLENFGVLEPRRIVRFWPVVLIGVGLMRLYHSVRSRTRPMGHVLLLAGVGLLLVNLGVLRVSQALAVFLLGAGGLMAFRAIQRSSQPDGPAALVTADRDLDLFAFMSYITRGVSSVDFRGGQASAMMGACEIDLRNARIEGGEAVVNVFAFWGGVEMRVPSDWAVEARGMAVLGAFEDSTRLPDDNRQKLIVTGMVIMGGVEIKN